MTIDELKEKSNEIKKRKNEIHGLFSQRLYTNNNNVDLNEEAVDFFELKKKYKGNESKKKIEKNRKSLKSNEPFSIIEGIDDNISLPIQETGYNTYEDKLAEAINKCKDITTDNPCSALSNTPVLNEIDPKTGKSIKLLWNMFA